MSCRSDCKLWCIVAENFRISFNDLVPEIMVVGKIARAFLGVESGLEDMGCGLRD